MVRTMAEFNLIEEPWIPCIDSHGQRIDCGIRDTLLKAHQLREICDDSPLVTVAIHRLLLAILYRTHSGPRDFKAWRKLYAGGAFDPNSITGYLNKWSSRFDLISDSRPFYQMAGLETKEAVPVTRLATECATGNNVTLFDHYVDDEEVDWPYSQAAKSLIACQSFALGFGRSARANIKGVDETRPYAADGIALRGMSIWLQGETLFETLTVNLAPTSDASLPPWELEDPHGYRDRADGRERRTVGSFGVVDRLTWQSRLVRLLPDDGTFSRMFFTQGRSADKSPGDPMKVYRVSKREGRSALPLSGDKAAWRDAHSILRIPEARANERRPECFNLVAQARSAGAVQPGTRFVAHVVGLASASGKAGKFLLWRHERMPVPGAMLADVNLVKRLGSLLENAEKAAREQHYRAWRVARFYRVPADREPNKKEKEDIDALVEKIDPRPAYWARLEKHFFELLENLLGDWDEAKDDWRPDEQQAATNAWRGHVKVEARRALEESIRSLGTTARAVQAVARVRTDFNDDDLKPPSQKAARASGKAKGVKKK
jgi:CRISPR system Cascade subunit CasA